jgi:YidC/Oxa1 family membrane protein insertase
MEPQQNTGFDKNALIGLTLIFLILIGFGWWQSSQQESSAPATGQALDTAKERASEQPASQPQAKTPSRPEPGRGTADTAAGQRSGQVVLNVPKALQPFAQGEQAYYTIENEVMKLDIAKQGGHIARVVMKEYTDHEGQPATLITPERQRFTYYFNVQNRTVSTEQLFFEPQDEPFVVEGDNKRSFALRVPLSEDQYLEQRYTLRGEDYQLDYEFSLVGFDKLIPRNSNYINLEWRQELQQLEYDIEKERQATTVYYKFVNDDPDDLSQTDDEDKEELDSDVQWVAHKQQFFTQSIIADPQLPFEQGNVAVKQPEDEEISEPLKEMTSELTLPYDHRPQQTYQMKMFMGPNDHKLLEEVGRGFSEMLPLGWFIFGLVNKYLIIPVFDYLDGRIASYGLIIVILTVLIKLITFPFTYKSFLSSAKMRLLKPELDKIKEKVGNDPQKQQQEQLKLYQRTGINPLGGCLPLLFQLPFLIAMFRFFPSSIELRHESFLWAKDLSTYDSIWDFGYVPIINTIYGDHVSLFALLMAGSVMVYSAINQQNTPTGPGQPEIMKYFPYIMPVFLLGLFNNMPAALCYYYFVYNLLSFAQTWGFRKLVNEEKLQAKLEANKKKPPKKGGFQKKLEEMSKQQEVMRKDQPQQRASNRSARRQR